MCPYDTGSWGREFFARTLTTYARHRGNIIVGISWDEVRVLGFMHLRAHLWICHSTVRPDYVRTSSKRGTDLSFFCLAGFRFCLKQMISPPPSPPPLRGKYISCLRDQHLCVVHFAYRSIPPSGGNDPPAVACRCIYIVNNRTRSKRVATDGSTEYVRRLQPAGTCPTAPQQRRHSNKKHLHRFVHSEHSLPR